MPETKTSYASKARREKQRRQHMHQHHKAERRVQSAAPEPSNRAQAFTRSKRSQSAFSMIMYAVVAVMCWLFAYSLALSREPNHALFAGMAALMGLMWSFGFFVSLRRWQKRR